MIQRHPSDVIPQGLIDKVVARRGGRLHMYERLHGPRTAFVVVDLDEHSVRRSSTHGWLCAAVNRLAATVRSAGGTVAFVTTRILSPDDLTTSLGGELAAEYFSENQPGGDGMRLADGLDVQPEDLHVVKARASAFFPGNCDLPELLQSRGIQHVLIAGLTTSVCCESSARDACELGYQVTMISDALGGQSFGVHESSLSVFFRNFGDVRPIDEVVDLLAHAPGTSHSPTGASPSL